MAKTNFWSDQENAKQVSQKCQQLKEELDTWNNLEQDLIDLESLITVSVDEHDQSLQKDFTQKVKEIDRRLKSQELFILFSEKFDTNNAILSIHSGTGGVEAQDWAAMLMRMYLRYAQQKKWQTKIIDQSKGNEAGVKSVTIEIIGRYAFGHLKAEAGVHRLVRISPFDAEKMRHTSFALVEVIPEMEEVEDIDIKDEDLKIDTYKSSGHGGQSVNTTDSAVRITHIPSKLVVSCQNERSQQQNRQTAMKVLKSKLFLAKLDKQQKEVDNVRGEVLSAEWGNQIRSYVLQPYKMVKDHRTKYESKDPDEVLDGEVDEFIRAYLEMKTKK